MPHFGQQILKPTTQKWQSCKRLNRSAKQSRKTCKGNTRGVAATIRDCTTVIARSLSYICIVNVKDPVSHAIKCGKPVLPHIPGLHSCAGSILSFAAWKFDSVELKDEDLAFWWAEHTTSILSMRVSNDCRRRDFSLWEIKQRLYRARWEAFPTPPQAVNYLSCLANNSQYCTSCIADNIW